MLSRVLVAFALALFGSATSCSEQTAHAVAAPEGAVAGLPVPPKKHAAACEAPAPMQVDMALGGSCASDADCKVGRRPRCVHMPTWVGPGRPRPGPRVRACVADACEVDGDCAPSELCFCGLGMVGTNICDESECHDDTDCGGAAGSCATDTAPVWASSAPPPRHVPHFCRRAEDECKGADDCNGHGGCLFDRRQGHFICVQVPSP